MQAPHQNSTDEIKRLRRCINDLVSVLSLPAVWTGSEATHIVRTLLTTLLPMLDLDFAYARLNGTELDEPIEFVEIANSMKPLYSPLEIPELIKPWLADGLEKWPRFIKSTASDRSVSIVPLQLGLHSGFGLIVAGSQRPDFPEQAERLVLSVAVNQALIGLQEARTRSKQEHLAIELDQRVSQRTTELTAANEQLKTEIEERKRAEEALDESERMSRLIVDNIPGLVALLTPSGEIEMVNRQLLEYFGQTLEELRRWGTNGTVHPDDVSGVIEIFAPSIASGIPYEIVQRLRRSDGTYRWIQNSGFPLRDMNGQISRWCVLLTDIDDQKRAEDAVRRSEAFLAEGQHLARLGNFSWRVVTKEITWSEQMYRIFGIGPGTPVTIELIGTRVHPDDMPNLYDMVERAQRGVSDFEYEHRLLMPDGSIKYLHLIAHRNRDDQDGPEYIGAVQDVTERRLGEEALNRVRCELEHASRVMTVGTLTASIAHEVNQPLSGIITNATTCLRMLSGEPPNVEGALETARRTIRDGNRASEVIKRLRALFGRKDFIDESIDLNEGALEVIALSRSELQRSQIILQTELAKDIPLVRGDRVQLQQVILNLLLNAADAMSNLTDRPRQLMLMTGLDENDRVRLSVRDVGIGFGPDQKEKLFDAFYTTRKSGMGIGLSVSKSIIERHNGRLWAESNEGQGATFSFSIPSATEGMIVEPGPEENPTNESMDQKQAARNTKL
jgi:PAS domain S-box-containing protein